MVRGGFFDRAVVSVLRDQKFLNLRHTSNVRRRKTKRNEIEIMT